MFAAAARARYPRGILVAHEELRACFLFRSGERNINSLISHYMCCSVVNKYDVQVDMPHGRGAVQVPRVAGEAGRYDAHQALHGAAQGRHRSVADCGHKVASDIIT